MLFSQARSLEFRFPLSLAHLPLLIALVAAQPVFAARVSDVYGPQAQTVGAQPTAPGKPSGVPYTAEHLNALLPPSVYFQGKTAPLQLRNAGGVSFAPNAIMWAALVDSSGYATSIQERYQFYLVTEAPLRIGEAQIPAGAYGGGFLGDRFVIMDLGGHTVAEGAVQTDTALPRPKPLQVVADEPASVKLFLGRHWVRLRPVSNTASH